MRDSVSSEDGVVRGFLYAGRAGVDWTFVASGLSTGATVDGGSGFFASRIIYPGPNILNFLLADFRGSCILSYGVTGIAKGETFHIEGPCIVEKDKTIDYDFVLSGDEEPFEEIMNGGGGDLDVRRRNLISGTFELAVFKVPDQPTHFPLGVTIRLDINRSGHTENGEHFTVGGFIPGQGSIKFGEAGHMQIKFVTPGIYQMEVVWKMASPPLGTGLVEVSRRKKLVVVTDAPTTVTVQGSPDAEAKPTGLTGVVRSEEEVDIGVQVSPPLPFPMRVAFLVERRAGSGGHEADHHGTAPRVEDGHWEIQRGPAASPTTHPTGGVEHILRVLPGGGGVAGTKYRSGEFGGRERVRVFLALDDFTAATTVELKNKLEDTNILTCPLGDVEINVRVPDLELLPAGTDYVKVGGTCQHHGPRDDNLYFDCRTPDNNHWGAHDVITALPQIAQQCRQSVANGGLGLGSQVAYNDISLGDGTANEGYGGRFDVNGDWTGSHDEHRDGRDVDVRTSPPHSAGIPVSSIAEFQDIVDDYVSGARVKIHSPGTDNQHFHIFF